MTLKQRILDYLMDPNITLLLLVTLFVSVGKPILLGVEGCAADLLRRANAGIAFAPEDASALVAAVEKLAGDRELARELGASGRRYVLRHFDCDKLSREYLDVLHRTVESPRQLAVQLCP